MEETDGFDAAVISYLQSLPRSAVIDWYSDHVSTEEPWSTAWVDVLSTQVQDAVPCNWVWTISLDPEGTAAWEFAWPGDMVVYRAWDPDWSWRNDDPDYHWDGPERAAVAVPIGEAPSPRQIKTLNDALAESSPECGIWGGEGWSVAAINRALEFWVAWHADRPDITFRWDPEAGPSPFLEAAVDTLSKVLTGEEDTVPFATLAGDQ